MKPSGMATANDVLTVFLATFVTSFLVAAVWYCFIGSGYWDGGMAFFLVGGLLVTGMAPCFIYACFCVYAAR